MAQHKYPLFIAFQQGYARRNSNYFSRDWEEFQKEYEHLFKKKTASSGVESAGVWIRATERLPVPGIYNAQYNGDHIIFHLHDGGFRIILYDGRINDAPQLNLIKWLDESQSTIAPSSMESDIAIGFVKWISVRYESSDTFTNKWYDPEGNYFTTEELHDLYLESLNKKL